MISAINLHENLEFLAANKWCRLTVDKNKALALRESAILRLKQFRQASVGLNTDLTPDIRNDRIFWLSSDLTDLREIELEALNSLDELRNRLRDFLRISLDEYECHFSYYAPGGHYVRHKDATALNNKRLVSFVIYLNENWSPADGGQIAGYDNFNNEIFRLDPEIGNMIVFSSDLDHEVISSKKDRLALTGWMRRK